MQFFKNRKVQISAGLILAIGLIFFFTAGSGDATDVTVTQQASETEVDNSMQSSTASDMQSNSTESAMENAVNEVLTEDVDGGTQTETTNSETAND